MCTLSAVALDSGALRVVMNRDERRLRPSGLPPALFIADGVRALWPVDSLARGTWIAVNEAGIVFALLNASPTPSRSRVAGGPSRGAIIPRVAGARGLAEAVRQFEEKVVATGEAWAPFALVVIAPDGRGLLTPHGADLRPPADAWVESSSTLGDGLVRSPREALFRHLLATSPSARVAQDRFHQHAWPDRRHLSVLMSRVEACTVSRTEVEISATGIEMRYVPIIDGWPVASAAGPARLRPLRAEAA